jgi:hypothetical protein
MNRFLPNLLFLVLSISVFAADSEKLQVTIPVVDHRDSTKGSYFNPFAIAGASLVVPGSVQIYTKHFIKGGMFLAGEAIAASMAVYWFKDSKLTKGLTKTSRLSAELDTGISKFQGLNKADLTEYDARSSRYRAYNSLAWASGVYVYSLLDAIDCSKIIDKSGARSPTKAGLLSAIPGLGLGQWYNGSLSRAGMIFMAQMSMGVMALDYHRLMTSAGNHYNEIDNEYNMHIADVVARGSVDTNALSESRGKYLASWESQRNSAFKTRNSYIWYSIFFYIYGIFDAVVDAHLHDYPEKMRMYPDLVPQSDGAILRLNVKY